MVTHIEMLSPFLPSSLSLGSNGATDTMAEVQLGFLALLPLVGTLHSHVSAESNLWPSLLDSA